jgi:hypothetical protein
MAQYYAMIIFGTFVFVCTFYAFKEFLRVIKWMNKALELFNNPINEEKWIV